MFWQIVLFIIIVFVGGILRAFIDEWVENMQEEFTDNKYEPVIILIVYIFALLLGFALSFYLAFAVRYSLIFLLDYTMNYWLVLGLLFSYRHLVRQTKPSRNK